MPAPPPVVTYCVITATGCGILTRELDSEGAARAELDRLLGTYPGAEVRRTERVGRGRRYYIQRNGEWLTEHYVKQGLSAEEIRAKEAAFEARDASGPRTYLGTFSRNNYHPNTGQNLRGARVVFQASSADDANDLMWDAFGDGGWYDAHDLEDLRDQRRKEGLTEDQVTAALWRPENFSVSWPTPEPVGETVTLRVRITKAQAAQSDVWIGRRCLMHRPTPTVPVLPGVGVWPEDDVYPVAWRAGPPTAGVLSEGIVFRVQYFPRAEAERAAAADPENIQIVEGSASFGRFRMPPKVIREEAPPVKSRIRVSGVFTIDMLYTLAEGEHSFMPVYRAVQDAWDALGDVPDERVFAVELADNRVVAIHVKPPERF